MTVACITRQQHEGSKEGRRFTKASLGEHEHATAYMLDVLVIFRSVFVLLAMSTLAVAHLHSLLYVNVLTTCKLRSGLDYENCEKLCAYQSSSLHHTLDTAQHHVPHNSRVHAQTTHMADNQQCSATRGPEVISNMRTSSSNLAKEYVNNVQFNQYARFGCMRSGSHFLKGREHHDMNIPRPVVLNAQLIQLTWRWYIIIHHLYKSLNGQEHSNTIPMLINFFFNTNLPGAVRRERYILCSAVK